MKKIFSSLVVMAVLVSLVGCSSEQETMSSKETVANTVKTDSLDTSLLTHKALDIGNGWAFGLPLNEGVNYRLTNVSYSSTISKFERIENPWFPNPTSPQITPFVKAVTNKTNSEVKIDGSITIDASLADLIRSKISLLASKTKSKEIVDTYTYSTNVPARKQVQLELYSQFKGYTAVLYQIWVIGDRFTATEKNGRLIIKAYKVTGNEFVKSHIVEKIR